MAGVGAHDDLFRKEIAKYDPICAEIADNIVAQEQLLLQIQVKPQFLIKTSLSVLWDKFCSGSLVQTFFLLMFLLRYIPLMVCVYIKRRCRSTNNLHPIFGSISGLQPILAKKARP